MNYYLFIDTTSNKINLAIISSNKKIIDTFEYNTNQDMIEHIINNINNLLKKNNIDIMSIKKIYFTDMFGLFTGLRTSSLIIKAWSTYNKKIKVYHMNTLAYNAKGKCISLMDAKSNKYYCAIYNNQKAIKKPMLIDDIELLKLKTKYNNYQTIFLQEINLTDLIHKLKYFKKINIKRYEINYLKAPC